MKVKVETYKLVCDCCGETFENLNGYTCFTEEFEKYRECKNEVEAYNKWDKEENPL